MRKCTALLLFASIIAIITAFQLSINSGTPILFSGGVIPPSVFSRHCILLSGETPGEYVLRAGAPLPEPLVLTLSDMGAARVFCDDALIYESTEESAYRRTQQIALPPEAFAQKGSVRIRIDDDKDYASAREVVTGTSIAPYKLYLSGASLAQNASLLSFGLVMGTMGMYLLSFFLCTILFAGKRSEKYLLTLSMISVICFVTSLFTTNNPLLALTYADYAVLRPVLSLCPLMINVGICLYLCEQSIPERFRRIVSIPMLVFITALLLILRFATGFSFYNIARLVLVIPVIWALSEAYGKRMKGSLLLIIGYATGESVNVAFFMINNLHLCRPGTAMGYVNLHHMSFLPVMLSALCVVCIRYSEKYRESERLTAELQQMNLRLDQKVIERTRQLVDEQGRRHNLMLNLIHDIKSPIFILLGYLDELRIPPEQENLRAIMLRKLSDVRHLVEDLFMSAKMEEDGVFYEEDRLDAGTLVRELVDEYGVEAARRSIRLSLDMPRNMRAILWADSLRLRQALQNLMDNAFTYTPDGGEIRVCCQVDEDTFRVSVCDTGKGIEKDDLPFVFERYFHARHADDPKSSGLGLSIARDIVEHSHGTISVTSERGVGTSFHMALPILKDERQA